MTEAGRTRHIKEFFDGDSSRYLTDRYPQEARTCDQFSYIVRRQYVLDMFDRIPHPGRVLDVGCGPAVLTPDLVARGWQVNGVDLSSGMLAAATRSAAALPGKRVAFAAAEATQLPFVNASFDAVLCIGVISYVHDVKVLLDDVRRVLRPGGQAILQISNAWSVAEVDQKFRASLKRLLRRQRQRDPLEKFDAHVKLRPYRPGTFERWCADAGLRPVEFRFYNFRPPRLVDRLAPAMSLFAARQLESLGRSRLVTGLGAGFLIRVVRGPEGA